MPQPTSSTIAEPTDGRGGPEAIAPPVSLLAELTHRCPLQCPYCSNPLALERAAAELDTATWRRVIEEAHALGVLQTHFSGGEPTLRRDLPELVRHASALGQYTNLITAAVLLDQAKLDALAEAGLDHVQISIQDSEPANADRIGGYKGGHAKKLAVARMVTGRGPAAHDQRGRAPPEPRPPGRGSSSSRSSSAPGASRSPTSSTTAGRSPTARR